MQPAESMAARQKDGPFRSLFDFCDRVDPAVANRTAIESLIKAGAFDSLGAPLTASCLDRTGVADRRCGPC